MSIKILNFKQVKEKTSLSRPTIWRKERAGTFVARRQISQNRVGWIESEIDDWIAGRTVKIIAPKKKRKKL